MILRIGGSYVNGGISGCSNPPESDPLEPRPTSFMETLPYLYMVCTAISVLPYVVWARLEGGALTNLSAVQQGQVDRVAVIAERFVSNRGIFCIESHLDYMITPITPIT